MLQPKMRISSRTSARIAATQALYQLAQDDSQTIEQIIQNFDGPVFEEDHTLPPMDTALFEQVTTGSYACADEINTILENVIKDGRVGNRMSMMMRSLLCPATYEVIKTATPTKVIISEYVGIANLFFHGRESAFIHDILAQISEKKD